MEDKDKINDIVNMLDQFMENGGGHMNITVGDDEPDEDVNVDIYRSTDCLPGDMACKVPTIHLGPDE